MVYFPLGQIMKWDNTYVSDHGRSALTITPQRIEVSDRMADGTLRKYYVVDKKEFSCSWEDIPSASSKTVDKRMGGKAMEDFYYSTPGAFPLVVTNGDGVENTYSVMFTEFNKEIKKRSSQGDLYSISVTMEEV